MHVTKNLKTVNERYYQRYDQLERLLSSCDHVSISIPELSRVGGNAQLKFEDLTVEQVAQFLAKAQEQGIKIGTFEYVNSIRSVHSEPNMSIGGDLWLSLPADTAEINSLGYRIKDVVYEIISQGNTEDFSEELTTHFQGDEEVINCYDRWAAHYDREHQANGWKKLLNYCANTLRAYVNSDDKILDIGCGTGLFGRELHAYNFQRLYGLDISQKSLDFSRALNIYQELYQVSLGNGLAFADHSFGALVSTGVFTRHQVPLTVFDALIRILKPGGILALVLRVEDDGLYYEPLQAYCAQNILVERLQETISAQATSNHMLVVWQKL